MVWLVNLIGLPFKLRSTAILVTVVLFFSPPDEKESHPKQLLWADDVLLLPEAGGCIPGETSDACGESSHRPSHCPRAGQTGLHSRLHCQGCWTLKTECGPYYMPWEKLSAESIWIQTGKRQHMSKFSR